MNCEILFMCKRRLSYGQSYGLMNSASFISNYLNNIGYISEVVVAIDGNEVDRLVTEYNPNVVIIEALWITPAKLAELMNIERHKKRTWVIRLHSRLAFLANEGMAFDWLLGYRKLALPNVFISPNTEELAYDLSRFGLQTVYLPNIYYPNNYDLPPKPSWNRKVFKVGCFGSIRPMKNHLTQAIAAIHFAEEKKYNLEFHINANRVEQKGEQVLKNLKSLFEGYNRHKLIEYDWMGHKDFVQVVRNMNMGMQVSLSESFNIVAADFVANNVPLIGSNQISWLPKIFQVKNSNSTKEIVDTMRYSWSWFGYLLRWFSKLSLRYSNSKSQMIWREFLKN
jgi:hypothetical protein